MQQWIHKKCTIIKRQSRPQAYDNILQSFTRNGYVSIQYFRTGNNIQKFNHWIFISICTSKSTCIMYFWRFSFASEFLGYWIMTAEILTQGWLCIVLSRILFELRSVITWSAEHITWSKFPKESFPVFCSCSI